MPPNAIDITDVNLYKDIGHNLVTVIVVLAVWAFFGVLLMWARWRDKQDETKVGVSKVVIPIIFLTFVETN